jgi:hypothetical protein
MGTEMMTVYNEVYATPSETVIRVNRNTASAFATCIETTASRGGRDDLLQQKFVAGNVFIQEQITNDHAVPSGTDQTEEGRVLSILNRPGFSRGAIVGHTNLSCDGRRISRLQVPAGARAANCGPELDHSRLVARQDSRGRPCRAVGPAQDLEDVVSRLEEGGKQLAVGVAPPAL